MIFIFVVGCSNVGRMERRYREGDVRQFNHLIETLSNEQYPYATRKKAARALGDIGDPKAVPSLINVLFDADPRDGLEIEAASALAMIKDKRAIQPLLRLLVSSQSADLRKATVTAIGAIGGTEAAEALIDALGYYAMLEARQRINDRQRLMEGGFPSERRYGEQDTTGMSMAPSLRGRPQGQVASGPVGIFGDVIPTTPEEDEEKRLTEERQVLTKAFVTVGQPAVPVLINRLGQTLRPGEIDIRDQIRETLSQLTQTPAPGDSGR
jgi:hypothetical protein